MLKKEIRVLGIDDGPFKTHENQRFSVSRKFNEFSRKSQKSEVLVVGTVFRGGIFLDGVLSTKVAIDGNDATEKIIKMVNTSKFKPQFQCILLNGIAVAGFNIIDIKELSEKTKIPVMVIIRKKPNVQLIKDTLSRINKSEKIALIEKAGSIMPVGKIFIQLAGIGIEKARQILKITCTRSLIPEPIRIAHLIASGITDGESRGKA